MDISNYRPPTQRALINDLAIRCFRDTGDNDYIAARLAMRSRLAGPFLWSSEQAIEKYLKCMLMLNRIPTQKLSHDIRGALRLAQDSLPFALELSEPEKKIFDHVADWDSDRYLTNSFALFDIELLYLDRLVWRLRQYCQPLDVKHYADEPSAEILLDNARRISLALNGPASGGHLPNAFLEKVLHDKKHPARAALVWKNLQYSSKARKGIRFPDNFQAVNSPLFLKPELGEEAARWMKIDKQVLIACKELAAERSAEKNGRKK